ncbi:hypothetical protein [Lysobacter gummosus]|uniref:hypothetical protein n=1 Tax=Lysobacter gummosus TaxID=262324 RepID=UPI00362C88DB
MPTRRRAWPTPTDGVSGGSREPSRPFHVRGAASPAPRTASVSGADLSTAT